MKRISSMIWAISLAALMLALAVLSGCRAGECQKMSRCCEAIQDEEGVGSACGEMAEGIKDPDTCRTILKAVDAMYQERDEPTPPVCE